MLSDCRTGHGRHCCLLLRHGSQKPSANIFLREQPLALPGPPSSSPSGVPQRWRQHTQCRRIKAGRLACVEAARQRAPHAPFAANGSTAKRLSHERLSRSSCDQVSGGYAQASGQRLRAWHRPSSWGAHATQAHAGSSCMLPFACACR